MIPAVRNSSAEISLVVTSDMTARLENAEIHPVYATFWLAYHAEVAARKAIEPFFEDGENAVGAAINIRHEAMAAVGAHVTIRATVVDIADKKVECAIEAFAGTRRLATGRQTQIVLPQSRISSMVEHAIELAATRRSES